MKIRRLFLALAAAAALAPPLSAQSTLKVQKLADGVWAAQAEKGANVGWFLLGDGVVAVDAGGDAATAKEMLQQIAETTGGKPVRALVLTHSHADHSSGARTFAAAGARVICHESAAGQILTFVTQAAADPGDPMAGKANLRPVVESISERAILVDGIHNVQIYHLGPGHTKSDLVIYLPGDKILYGGDLALNGRLPFMQSPDVDPSGWTRSLLALNNVHPEKLVPGHGEIGPVTGIAESLAYVRQVDELSRKLVDSGIRDEMIDTQIRAPENTIPGITVTDAHAANIKAAIKAQKEKVSRKPTPAPTAATPTVK